MNCPNARVLAIRIMVKLQEDNILDVMIAGTIIPLKLSRLLVPCLSNGKLYNFILKDWDFVQLGVF
jgi:hypothetical protein